MAAKATVDRDGIWSMTITLDVLVDGRNQQFVVGGIPDIKLMTGDESVLGFVYTQFVTELHGLSEFAFFNRASFGIKEADDPIRNDPVAGYDFLSLRNQSPRPGSGFRELRLKGLFLRLATVTNRLYGPFDPCADFFRNAGDGYNAFSLLY